MMYKLPLPYDHMVIAFKPGYGNPAGWAVVEKKNAHDPKCSYVGYSLSLDKDRVVVGCYHGTYDMTESQAREWFQGRVWLTEAE